MVFATFLHETTAQTAPTFSFTNLLILLIVIAVVYPVVTRLRRRVSESRRERWAREEGWDSQDGQDPDLGPRQP